MKAVYGKTVCTVCAADGGQRFTARLLRPDTGEAAQDNAVEGRGPALIKLGKEVSARACQR